MRCAEKEIQIQIVRYIMIRKNSAAVDTNGNIKFTFSD